MTFFVMLCIILFAPIIMSLLRIPHIVGMVLAGVAIGPHGLNILANDRAIELFGHVGLYYIMLLAGLEMNTSDLRKNRTRTFTHGILAFIIPMAIGFALNKSVLGYGFVTSALLASMYASHTLIAYPTVLRYGLSGERSVTIAVGATAITDTLTLLVLAMVGGIFKGNITGGYWLLLFVKIAVVFCAIIYGFPPIARRFFRRYEDNVTQFIFVLAMTFLGAGLMELIGMEGLLGAFLTGLVLNRYVPNVSPLMFNLEFVGNALFIPYFLIGVGMMVNVRILFGGLGTLQVAAVMIAVALASKWLASLATQKIFGMKAIEREMIFGLSNAQAGATLAAVLVGYNLLLPNGQRVLNDDVLNGTIILILVTCVFSSFTTERASRIMALKSRAATPQEDGGDDEKIMVPVRDPATADTLTSLAVMVRNKKLSRGLVALNVVYDDNNRLDNQERGRRLMARVEKVAGYSDVRVQTQVRIATNITNGIKHAFKEFNASEIILGMNSRQDDRHHYLGELAQSLYNGLSRQIMLVRCRQPLNTLRRIQVAVPSKAEFEPGFYRWLERLARLATNLECRLQFHGRRETMSLISEYMQNTHPGARTQYTPMGHWNELPQLAASIAEDNLFVVVTARKGTVSYKAALDHLQDELAQHFRGQNLMIIYPDQHGVAANMMTYAAPQPHGERSAYEVVKEWIGRRMSDKKTLAD